MNIRQRLLKVNQRAFHVMTKGKSSEELHALAEAKSPTMRVGHLTVLCQELGERGEVEQEKAVAAELLGLAHGKEKLGYRTMVSALSCVAKTYERLDEHAAAIPLRDELVLIEQGMHGPTSPQAISALVRLTVDLRKSGDLPRVVEVERKILERTVKQCGPGDPVTLSLRAQLGADLCQLGAHAESIAELEIVVALLAVSAADGMKARQWLARNLAVKRDFAGALAIREEILDERRRSLGPEDRETLVAVEYVASMHFALGHSALAKQLLEGALASRERRFGDADPQTQAAKRRLAENFGPFD